MRRAGVLLAAVLLGCSLGGCGAQRPDAGPTEQSRPSAPSSRPAPAPRSAIPTASATVDTTAPDVGDLTRRAESAATELADPGRDRRLLGADVSWPQCPAGMGIAQKRSEGLPMPTEDAAFVILGLTNGPSFVANPCLDSQVAWVRERGLLAAAYAVISFPDESALIRWGGTGPYDGADRIGRLSNVGYQAARFNLATMVRVGLRSPIVWVDVEPVARFDWSPDPVANAAVVRGAERGYRDAGVAVGFYSTPALWRRIVGDLRFGAPEWRAAGPTSMAEALRRCRADWSFQGGTAVLGQWVQDRRDRNVTCPGQGGDPSRWFHRY